MRPLRTTVVFVNDDPCPVFKVNPECTDLASLPKCCVARGLGAPTLGGARLLGIKSIVEFCFGENGPTRHRHESYLKIFDPAFLGSWHGTILNRRAPEPKP